MGFGSADFKKILSNTGWLVIERAIRLLVSLILIAWIARYLGPTDFGAMSLAIAFVALFSALGSSGLQGIVVREVVDNPNKTDRILSSAIFLQVIGSILVLILVNSTAVWVLKFDFQVAIFVLVVSLSQLFKPTETLRYWFEARIDSKPVAIAEIITFLLCSLLRVCLIWNSLGPIWFVWAVVIESALTGIGLTIVFFLRREVALNFKLKKAQILKYFNQGWPLALSAVAVMLYMKVDQVMLGIIKGRDAVGVYTVAVRLSEAWYFLPIAAISSAFPALLSTRSSNPAQYLRRLQRLYTSMTLLAYFVAIPMTFLSGFFVTILFGESYMAAAPVLALHIWGSIFVILGLVSGKWLVSENLQKLALYRTVVGAAINILLNLLLIPLYGIFGAAIATVLSLAFAGFFFDMAVPVMRKSLIMKLRALTLQFE